MEPTTNETKPAGDVDLHAVIDNWAADHVVVILRGIPGAGKSTFADLFMIGEEKRGRMTVRINRDDLRTCINGSGDPHGPGSGRKEILVTRTKATMLEEALTLGFNVILDDTHVPSGSVDTIHKSVEELATRLGKTIVVMEYVFHVFLEDALERNAGRVGYKRVPPKIIEDMFHRFPHHNPRLIVVKYSPNLSSLHWSTGLSE